MSVHPNNESALRIRQMFHDLGLLDQVDFVAWCENSSLTRTDLGEAA